MKVKIEKYEVLQSRMQYTNLSYLLGLTSQLQEQAL